MIYPIFINQKTFQSSPLPQVTNIQHIKFFSIIKLVIPFLAIYLYRIQVLSATLILSRSCSSRTLRSSLIFEALCAFSSYDCTVASEGPLNFFISFNFQQEFLFSGFFGLGVIYFSIFAVLFSLFLTEFYGK